MAHFYHVTIQRPTAVIASCIGNFCTPDQTNLIIVKNTCIEVYAIDSCGLKQIKDIPVNASIVVAKTFRTKNCNKDSLLVLTINAQVAIINCEFRNNDYEFVTVASGSIEDKGVPTIDNGCDALIDPGANYIVIRFYYGLLKVISLNNLGNKISSEDALESSQSNVNTYTLRIPETNVVDMVFLHGYQLPTFAMIYVDEVVVHMKTYEIYGREPTLRNIHPTLNSIETDSKLLIPVEKPHGGFIIVSDKMVVYQSKEGPHVAQYIPIAQPSTVLCYTKMDANRYILGDLAGRLYMLLLQSSDDQAPVASSSTQMSKINSISVELLGEIVIPETLAYLGSGVVFIGSCFGDSQLIRLSLELDQEKNSYVTVLDNFTNIGSIVDMCMFENKEQSQLITCSGALKEGSLRVILNGIGIHEHANIEQEFTKSVWCFSTQDPDYHDAILVSQLSTSQLLSITEDNLAADSLQGLCTEEQTIYCNTIYFSQPTAVQTSTEITSSKLRAVPGVCHGNAILQVTSSSLRLVGVLENKGLLAQWSPPTGKNVSCAACHLNMVLVASASDLYALEVVKETGKPGQMQFKQVAHRQMSNEVACIDLSPCDDNHHEASQFAAVGLWLGHGIALLSLPDLKVLCEASLPDQGSSAVVLPRSILITQLEEIPRLFVAMGDGTLHYYTINKESANSIKLIDPKKVNAGSGPTIYLRQWRSQMNKNNIFVCSNRPCVMYSAKQKLVFANVNLQEVLHMTPLNGKFYSNCLCLVTPNSLVIGSVDEIKKLHIRTIPLEETPRRLALQPETNSLAVISYRQEIHQSGYGFRPLRQSISLNTKVPRSVSQTPKFAPQGTSQFAEAKQSAVDVSSLLIFDKTQLDLQAVHTFYYHQAMFEMATCITSMKMVRSGTAGTSGAGTGSGAEEVTTASEDVLVYVVGTAFIIEAEKEPSRGRIHVFRWDEQASRLTTLLVHDVAGTVFRVVDFHGKLLAGIASSVRLFEIQEASLRVICSYNENITVLAVKSRNDYVLVGDIMRSLTLLLHKPNVQSFDVIGKHRESRWLTNCEILDDDHFIAAETDHNIFVVTRESAELTHQSYSGLIGGSGSLEPTVRALFVGAGIKARGGDESVNKSISSGDPPAVVTPAVTGTLSQRNTLSENRRLVDCAFMHVGDFVNSIIRGSMVQNNAAIGAAAISSCTSNETWPAVNPESFTFGTVKGALGQIFQVSPVLFAFLKEVESRLEKLIVPVGRFSHEDWRAFRQSKRVKVAQNFVDGDLIEQMLDLSLTDKRKLVEGLYCPVALGQFGTAGTSTYTEPEVKACTVEDLTLIIEEMTRLH